MAAHARTVVLLIIGIAMSTTAEVALRGHSASHCVAAAGIVLQMVRVTIMVRRERGRKQQSSLNKFNLKWKPYLSVRQPPAFSSLCCPAERGVWSDRLLLSGAQMAVPLASRGGAGTRLYQGS